MMGKERRGLLQWVLTLLMGPVLFFRFLIGGLGLGRRRDAAPASFSRTGRTGRTGRTLAPAPDWSQEHMVAWATFLNSPVGQDLMARGRAVAAVTAEVACADVFHTQHSAGRAKGFYDCLSWMESLSRSSRVNEVGQAGPSGEQELLETKPATSMQSSQWREELREHYAP